MDLKLDWIVRFTIKTNYVLQEKVGVVDLKVSELIRYSEAEYLIHDEATEDPVFGPGRKPTRLVIQLDGVSMHWPQPKPCT